MTGCKPEIDVIFTLFIPLSEQTFVDHIELWIYQDVTHVTSREIILLDMMDLPQRKLVQILSFLDSIA